MDSVEVVADEKTRDESLLTWFCAFLTSVAAA